MNPYLLLRRSCLLLFIVLPFAPYALTQLVNGRLITSVSTWERFDTVDVSKKYARGFQSVLLDIGQGNFSLHTHLQGASILESKLPEEPDFRAFSLYAKFRNLGDGVDLSLGRMPFFVGVGSGTLDGGLLTGKFIESKLRVTAYGGANVPTSLALSGWKPVKNNFTLGGQILVMPDANSRIGASYYNRKQEREAYWTTRIDSLLTLLPEYITPPADKEQYMSGDVSYRRSFVDIYGRYDYDLNDKETQRGQVGVRVTPTPSWRITADFIHREPRIIPGSFFSLFQTSSITEYEGGVDYIILPEIRAFVRGAFVQYDGDDALRYTVGLAHDFASVTFRGSNGYAGELASISLSAVYPLCERMVIPHAGLSFISYKLNASAEKQEALAGTLGATVRPWQFLSFDVQGQVLNNPVYKSDVRLFGRISFWFSEQLHLFE